MAKATVTGTSEQVALTKALLMNLMGKLSDDEFRAAAKAIGYTPQNGEQGIRSFKVFAYEEAIRLLER